MDDQPVNARSLQSELTRWIAISTLAICTLGGITTGIAAYIEAKDLQDEVLVQIARLVADSDINQSRTVKSYYKDSAIIVENLGNQSNRLAISAKQPDGFDTIQSDHDSWRVFLVTKPNQERFVVAQQTELINEIAWANTLSAILPICILAIILMGLIHWIIARRMKPIAALAQTVDRQTATKLNTLSTKSIPVEIVPFIDAINRLLGRTRQTIERQQRFIADASHELRTPITALSLLAENMQKAQSEPERQQRQTLLRQGLDRLNKLVNQLLDLARLQNTESDSTDQVQLDEIVKDTVVSLYPLAEQKQIDLGITKTTAVTVQGNSGGLTQLVENAIANAIRYTPSQGKIDISLDQIGNTAEFIVEDTGPGINEEDIQKVLTPFYRGKDQTEIGSGLGLAICSEIAKQHQGEIKLENRKSGGLRFIYRQPNCGDSYLNY